MSAPDVTMTKSIGARRASVFALLCVLTMPTAARAADSEAEFKSAYAAAEAAAAEAGRKRNQWTTTQASLANAQQAAAIGDFDRAVALSKAAEALARASIFQAEREQDAWQAIEIH
jgi:hypothetical protein